jgi:hypothetical protein
MNATNFVKQVKSQFGSFRWRGESEDDLEGRLVMRVMCIIYLKLYVTSQNPVSPIEDRRHRGRRRGVS